MALPTRHHGLSQRPVARWEPFSQLEQLQEQTARLMETVLAGDGERIWSPVADIEETDDAWIVEAELPGVKREDVNVEMHDSELVITGEIKERERKGILRRRTRKTGEFDYRVTLPGHVDASNIEASLNDGILTVRVPKSEQARARRIEVK